MDPDTVLLSKLLAYAALIASTIEYCEILKRRKADRREAALREECAETGLQALVRVFEVGADEPRGPRRRTRVGVRRALIRGDPPPRLSTRLSRPIIAPP